LFQVNSNRNELENLLEEELECFRALLQFTEKSLSQIDKLPVNVLTEMLNYRQEWIDKIQDLEHKRKLIVNNYPDVNQEDYLEKISSVAGDLVEIDNQIYKNLEYRKMKYVQQISDNALNRNYIGKKSTNSNILDITQE